MQVTSHATKPRVYTCAICGTTLAEGRYIVGRDRSITGATPRYCPPSDWPECERRSLRRKR